MNYHIYSIKITFNKTSASKKTNKNASHVRMLMNRSVFKSSVFKDRLACYSLVDGVKTPLQRL